VKENRDGQKKGATQRREKTNAHKTKTKMMNALFANSLQIPVTPPLPPHLPVPFCRGNLPALDENGIKNNIYG
jgi:hypothetical protein